MKGTMRKALEVLIMARNFGHTRDSHSKNSLDAKIYDPFYVLVPERKVMATNRIETSKCKHIFVSCKQTSMPSQ